MHSRLILAHTAGLALVAAATAHAGLGVETVSDSAHLLSPSFGATHDADLVLTQFDTLGGTRQLVSVDFYWKVTLTFSASYAANTTTDTIGSQIEWETSWRGNLDGIALPPTPDLLNENQLFFGFGIGEDSEPGDPAGIIDFSEFGGSNEAGLEGPEDGLTDPALLAALTGSGVAHIDGLLEVSEAVEVPYGGVFHDIFFPDVVFVPGYMSASFDSYTIELSATYHFVPGPGALGVCGVGMATMIRRRRRGG